MCIHTVHTVSSLKMLIQEEKGGVGARDIDPTCLCWGLGGDCR